MECWPWGGIRAGGPARAETHLALELTRRLPAVLGALLAGDIDLRRAKTLEAQGPQARGYRYGTLRVDMSRVQQWTSRESRLQFQLKRDQEDWLTYLADTNRTKTMLLRLGNYYLKVNGKVRKAFILTKEDQEEEVQVK